MKLLFKSIIVIALIIWPLVGYSQKGDRNAMENCYTGVKSEVIDLFGIVQSIETAPCTNHGRRSASGTHLMLTTKTKKTLNIHLGPTTEVAEFIAGIKGEDITIKAFSSPELATNHYIAKALVVNDKVSVLRDDNLRPIWAGKGLQKDRGRRKGGKRGR